MKFKKVLAKILVLAMAVGSFTGCGKEEMSSQESSESSQIMQSSENVNNSEVVEQDGPITTDPITIDIYITWNASQKKDVKDLWFYQYLEWWINEQGYNVTLDVFTATDAEQQKSLMLASDDLPDLIIGGGSLSTANAVLYGAEEQMILDWSPYLNEETMPNLMRLIEENPDALAASTCFDGGVYSLPTFKDRGWGQAAGNQPYYMTMFVNKNWLDECDIEELPTTYEGMIDMLRTFKEEIEVEGGLETIPLLGEVLYTESAIWTGLGYYGYSYSYSGEEHGTFLGIKDGEVHLGAYTEDYAKYIEIMKTMYDEGLVSKDYLTMGDETRRGLISAGQAGVVGCGSLAMVFPETYTDWIAMPPLTVGDNTNLAGSVNATYSIGTVWASAKTEYPEVLALLLDYMYSPEGSTYYYYGPMKGTDPLNIEEGWWFNEEGQITNKQVEAGEYDSYQGYMIDYINPSINIANYIDYTYYAKELAGLGDTKKVEQWPDVITGDTFEVVWKVDYVRDNADGYMRHERIDNWGKNTTTVNLSPVYMTAEDSSKAAELKLLINDHIITESAKFITGVRSLDEIDEFQQELKDMGVEEYIELYRNAYSIYMDSVFN